MGILRVLLITVVILIICLILLPRTNKEKVIQLKLLKFIASICILCIISFSFALYFFKDTLWADTEYKDQIMKKVYLEGLPTDNNEQTRKALKLTNYDLHNFPIKQLIEVLENDPNIKTLYLKSMTIENAQQVSLFLPNNKFLDTIIMANTNSDVLQKLFEIVPHTKSLKILVANNNKIDLPALNNLKKAMENSTLKELELDNTKFGDDIAKLQIINDILTTPNTMLTRLSLRSNSINDQDLIALISNITSNTKILELDLWNNDIKNLGAKSIADLLIKNSSLTELSLGYNDISDAGIIYIANALSQNTTLKKLDLSRNPFYDEATRVLATSLQKNHTLKQLKLHTEGISKEQLKKLEYLFTK